MQRDLVETINIKRATLSGIVTMLVRKGLVSQIPDADDQRQGMLQLTQTSKKLWDALPPMERILQVSFDREHSP